VTRVAAGHPAPDPVPRPLLSLLAAGLVGAGLACAGVARWYHAPAGSDPERVVVEIPAGSGTPAIARILARSGVVSSARLFALCTRLDGRGRRLRAGEYAVARNLSPAAVADLLIDGRVVLHPITLVEGWTVAEAVRSLGAEEVLRADLPGPALTDGAALLTAIGRPGPVAEGHFFPDTYAVARGTPVSQVLRLAHDRLKEVAGRVWAGRDPGLPLENEDAALILASLIEKETAAPDERPLIAAVFINRLRLGMRLQTDPSVIYGLGARYDGSLHHADLLNDTPYNTYTRSGLPPTPIALPGRAALEAAVHPAASDALYFVARADGSGRHRFSATLAEHNLAVNQYIERLRDERGPARGSR
jgi:UPF0755 protein